MSLTHNLLVYTQNRPPPRLDRPVLGVGGPQEQQHARCVSGRSPHVLPALAHRNTLVYTHTFHRGRGRRAARAVHGGAALRPGPGLRHIGAALCVSSFIGCVSALLTNGGTWALGVLRGMVG